MRFSKMLDKFSLHSFKITTFTALELAFGAFLEMIDHIADSARGATLIRTDHGHGSDHSAGEDRGADLEVDRLSAGGALLLLQILDALIAHQVVAKPS